MTKERKFLGYQVSTYKAHGYGHLHVNIRDYRRESVRKKMLGAQGNKDGYGSPEVAEKMENWYKRLLSQGHTEIYDPAWRSNSFAIEWQEYNPSHDLDTEYGYCGARVNVSEHYEGTLAVAKVVEKIGKKVALTQKEKAFSQGEPRVREPGDWVLENPGWVFEALDALGAKRLMLVRDPKDSFRTVWAVDTSPLPWVRSDDLYKLFGLSDFPWMR